MAKTINMNANQKQEKYLFPSRYGSHTTMIAKQSVQGQEAEQEYPVNSPDFVVCEDEHGLYVTKRTNLDSRLADPYRFAHIDERDAALEKHGHKNTKKRAEEKVS